MLRECTRSLSLTLPFLLTPPFPFPSWTPRCASPFPHTLFLVTGSGYGKSERLPTQDVGTGRLSIAIVDRE